MDNAPTGFTDLYDPLVASGLIYDPSTNTYIPADSTAGTGSFTDNTVGSTVGPAPATTGVGGLVNSLISEIPGASTIEALLKAVGSLPLAIENLINAVEGAHPWEIFTKILPFYADGLVHLVPTDTNAWNFIKGYAGGGLFESMLHDGLGVEVSEFDAEALQGVNTVDRMLKFVFVLQYGMAALNLFGKGIFANRFGEALQETIAKIPEEMGLSWALGLTIDESFKTAVGRSLEEGINYQKRGNRLEWPQLKILSKQHVLDYFDITPDGKLSGPLAAPDKDAGKRTFRRLLQTSGFPDEYVDMLEMLANVQLPVGDMQQMYLHGIMTDDEVKASIAKLGFDDEDVRRLYTMYIAKAETESSSTLRSTARALFTQNLITEQHYRDILTKVNYAELLIDDDIEAVNLLHETGRVQTSLTSIKSQYQHHSITPQVAIQLLKQLNYTDEAITNLFKTWDLPPLLRSHHLSQAKVLSYLVSGLLTPQDATTRLIAMGMDVDDAALLVAHPTASAGVRQHGLTTGMITQAYAEGIIDYGTLPDLFTKVGVTAEALPHYLDQAYWKRSHFKQAPDHKNTLTDGDIRAAFKNGLMDQTTATSLLVANGWSADDALLLLEITNKGLITPHVTAFATPQQAVEFLLYYGWTVQGPPDPIFMEAEVAAQTAGFTVSPPAGWDPYNPTVPSGGPPPPLPIPSPVPPPPIGTPPPAPVPLPGI